MHVKKASIIGYDTRQYDFAGWARAVLGVADLAKIHERADLQAFGARDVVKQIDLCRRALSDTFAACEPLYDDFIKSVVAPLFGGVKSYQKPPSFRFHYRHRGSSAFHRDRDYGVQNGRLNVWVPLTPVCGDNSIWIESEVGKADFAPVALNYGQALVFDGSNLCHGSKLNFTNSSRVSFDFRFAPGNGA